ncbi:Hypothetical predicted protein [Marmota monax]|uniref:Carboxypeptidase n=1 Tax=Marmota monax TaxID=9995 RepID=A0A5E4AF43_MARMO|nr:hypothetical protein GHT09_000502 [Marmota monax]VTJ56007.1 Hypothetical predicted protein [Marmota monax]
MVYSVSNSDSDPSSVLTVLPRNFPWTTTLSMLYMDNPVGTGFSFTNNSQGYAVNEDDVAHNLYSALVQFFQLFPEYENNDFYATGESYAGKYVPALAHYIHTLNPKEQVKIHLKGIALGNAYSDPESIIKGYAPFLYEIGLLDERQRKYFQKQCNKCIKYIKEENWLRAFEEPGDQTYYGKFLSLSEVRRAIHVGNQTFSDGADVEKYLRQDTMKSVKTWLTEIMNNNYKVLLYNGQLDIIVAASLTERSLMTMNWKGFRKYKKSRRVVWKIFKSDNEVAGYVRQVENFHQCLSGGGLQGGCVVMGGRKEERQLPCEQRHSL